MYFVIGLFLGVFLGLFLYKKITEFLIKRKISKVSKETEKALDELFERY